MQPRMETRDRSQPPDCLGPGRLGVGLPRILLRGALRPRVPSGTMDPPAGHLRHRLADARRGLRGAGAACFAAFQADQASDFPDPSPPRASALYAKYGRIDPRFTTAVVRESGRRMVRVASGPRQSRSSSGWEGLSRHHPRRQPDLAGDGASPQGVAADQGRRACRGGSWRPTNWPPAWSSTPAASEDAYTSERGVGPGDPGGGRAQQSVRGRPPLLHDRDPVLDHRPSGRSS